MKESFSNERNIDVFKPKMKVLTRLEAVEVTAETVVSAKLDGEFDLLSYTRNGETYLLNRWGHRRQDFPALDEFVEAMNKTSVSHAELLCELHGKIDGKPTNLPTFIRFVKGKNRELDKVHIGIWDLIGINNHKPNETYIWKLEEVQRWIDGCTHVSVVPYLKPCTLQDVKDFWNVYVEKQGYEGLVIRNGVQIYKIKPCLDVDAVIIGLNKTSSYGKKLDGFQHQQVTSVKLGLMQDDGTFIELSDCASGITVELRKALWKLMDYKVGEDARTVYVKPIVVCTIEYTDTYKKSRQILKFNGEKYLTAGTKEFVSLRHPRIKRFRPDKTVTVQDLRTTQIPEGKPLEFLLYQADCRRVLPTIPKETINLIISSPPYWRVKQYSGVEGEIGGETRSEYIENMLSVFKECYRLLKPDGLMMLNIDNGKREDGFITVSAWDWIKPLREIGFRLTQTIIWVDNTKRPLRHPRLLNHHYEPIIVLAKGKNYTWNWQEIEQKSDVWHIQHWKGYAREQGDQWDRMGIATFPVALIEQLITLGSKEGDWTLDMFAGSGTVFDVAQRLGRNNISIEISEDYCQTIVSRCFNKHKLHSYRLIPKQNTTT